MVKEDKLNEVINQSITHSWIGIVALGSYLAKKIADLVFGAVIEKFQATVKEEVSAQVEPLVAQITKYQEDHHGVIQKNEAVLLEALETLKQERNDK